MSETPHIPFGGAQDINRAYSTKRDNDTFKTPSITLYDVDYAVMYFLREVIKLQVEQNGRIIEVPLAYGTGELWSQIQARGFMRDKEGKLLVPYAVITRTSMAEDERFKRMDTNYGPDPLQVYLATGRDSRTFNDIHSQHSFTYNTNPEKHVYISVIPEFYVLEYELILYASYMEQLNQMIQDIIVTSNFVWGDSYKFRTVVGDASFETINPTSGERIVKATIGLTTDCRLQNEFELKRSTITKAFSPKRVIFSNERSSFDARIVDKIP